MFLQSRMRINDTMKCTQHFKSFLNSVAFLIFKSAKSLRNSVRNRNQSNDKVFFDDFFLKNEVINTVVLPVLTH